MKRTPCILTLSLCLALTGCRSLPAPREMGDMALLRTMGVDGTEGDLSVTVSTGPRAKGLQGEREAALILSARNPSLSGAALTLQGQSDSYVFFGYVDQLLLGEDLTRRGIEPVLDYFARDVDLGLGARIWIARGATARAAVESGGDQGVESRLSTLRTDGEMGTAAVSRTAGEVYADLLEWGTAYVPALTIAEGDGASLVDGGYAVFKGDALVGFLEGEQARGLELLAGRPSADALELELPSGQVTVQVEEAITRCRLLPGGAGLSLTCRVTAHLVEYEQPLNRTEREVLREQIRVREESRIRSALTRLQSWETDCLGLGPRAALTSPGRWSAVREDWPRIFAREEPELAVQVELRD